MSVNPFLVVLVSASLLFPITAWSSTHNFEVDVSAPTEVGKGSSGSVVVTYKLNRTSYRGRASITSSMTKAQKTDAVRDAILNARTVYSGKPVTGVTATVTGGKVEATLPSGTKLDIKSIKLKETDTVTKISRDMFNRETKREKLSYGFFEDVVQDYLARVEFTTYLGTLGHSILLNAGTTGEQATQLFHDYFTTQAPQLDVIGLELSPLEDGYGNVVTRMRYPFDTPISILGEGEGLETGVSQVPVPASGVLLLAAFGGLRLFRRMRSAG